MTKFTNDTCNNSDKLKRQLYFVDALENGKRSLLFSFDKNMTFTVLIL